MTHCKEQAKSSRISVTVQISLVFCLGINLLLLLFVFVFFFSALQAIALFKLLDRTLLRDTMPTSKISNG